MTPPPSESRRESFQPLLSASPPPLFYDGTTSPSTPNYKYGDSSTFGPDRRLSGFELRGVALERARQRGSIAPQTLTPSYRPVPFTSWFSVLLLFVMVLYAMTCEVLLYYSNENHGFDVSSLQQDLGTSAHYLWTTLPVALVAATVVAPWEFYSWWVKASQPYMDLSAGQATAESSLLLNYTSDSNWLILYPALKRRHYLTLLATLFSILTWAASPLASAMFSLKQITLPGAPVTSVSLAQFGLGSDVASAIAYVASAGYAISTVESNTSWPPFLDGANGALIPFEVPSAWGLNGSVFTNTSSIKSSTNCVSAPASASLVSDYWQVNLSGGGCSNGSVQVTPSDATGQQFFVLPVQCDEETDAQFQPATFVVLDPGSGAVTASLCFPKVEVLPVLAGIDLATTNILQTQVTGPAVTNTALSQAPFLGRALNGIAANASAPSSIVDARITATRSTLAATVQKELQITGTATDITSFNAVVQDTYIFFLASLAPLAYFEPASQNIDALLHATVTRLLVTPAVAHVLTALFLVLAIGGGLLMRAHASAVRQVGCHLPENPGTIASAVAVAGQTSGLVSAKDDTRLMSEVLRQHRYGLDKDLGYIVVVDSPQPGRR